MNKIVKIKMTEHCKNDLICSINQVKRAQNYTAGNNAFGQASYNLVWAIMWVQVDKTS